MAWRANQIYVQTMNNKRLPTLESVMPPAVSHRKSGRPSIDQQKANFMKIAQQYGMAIKEVQVA